MSKKEYVIMRSEDVTPSLYGLYKVTHCRGYALVKNVAMFRTLAEAKRIRHVIVQRQEVVK